jgi:hypothetical protein
MAPAAAPAETQKLTCTVGKKPMTLVYEGDDMSGTLTATTPWGDMTFPDVTYAGGDPVGEFSFRASASQPAVVMPNLAKMEACLKGFVKSPGELMDLNLLQIYMTGCQPKIPEGKPVAATVEINGSVTQDYGVDVYVYRTYAAESAVADGHIVIDTEPAPKCVVAPQ